MARELPLRTRLHEADIGNVVCLKHLDAQTQEKKVHEIRNGAEILEDLPPFPESRHCQDVIWAVLFVGTLTGFLALAATTAGCVLDGSCRHSPTTPEHLTKGKDVTGNIWQLLSAGLAGVLASLVAAFAFIVLARFRPQCVVWTSFYFTCFMMAVQGLLLVVFGSGLVAVFGACYLLLSVAIGFCLWCCMRDRIQFTIAVVQTVADVADDHPCMVWVSFMGSVCSVIATAAFGILSAGVAIHNDDVATNGSNKATLTLILGAFVFFWTSGVIYGVCHLIYCGVFGRWYFGPNHEDGDALGLSVAAAFTSFGSVCLGSFMVAVVHAFELLARTVRQTAQEEGNIIGCIVMCAVECILSCLGDILEYFNDWGYVQCAIRNASYCQAARITFSLCTCANISFVYADLLVGAVVMLGAVFCMLVGSGVAAAVAFVIGAGSDRAVLAAVGAALGAVGGLLAGGSAMSIFTSGTKTLLSAWAEDPRPLAESHPEIHQLFCERIVSKAY